MLMKVFMKKIADVIIKAQKRYSGSLNFKPVFYSLGWIGFRKIKKFLHMVFDSLTNLGKKVS